MHLQLLFDSREICRDRPALWAPLKHQHVDKKQSQPLHEGHAGHCCLVKRFSSPVYFPTLHYYLQAEHAGRSNVVYRYQSHLLVFPWPVVFKCNIAYFERFRNGYTQCTWESGHVVLFMVLTRSLFNVKGKQDSRRLDGDGTAILNMTWRGQSFQTAAPKLEL